MDGSFLYIAYVAPCPEMQSEHAWASTSSLPCNGIHLIPSLAKLLNFLSWDFPCLLRAPLLLLVQVPLWGCTGKCRVTHEHIKLPDAELDYWFLNMSIVVPHLLSLHSFWDHHLSSSDLFRLALHLHCCHLGLLVYCLLSGEIVQ